MSPRLCVAQLIEKQKCVNLVGNAVRLPPYPNIQNSESENVFFLILRLM